jgi:hypothetical protein
MLRLNAGCISYWKHISVPNFIISFQLVLRYVVNLNWGFICCPDIVLLRYSVTCAFRTILHWTIANSVAARVSGATLRPNCVSECVLSVILFFWLSLHEMKWNSLPFCFLPEFWQLAYSRGCRKCDLHFWFHLMQQINICIYMYVCVCVCTWL